MTGIDTSTGKSVPCLFYVLLLYSSMAGREGSDFMNWLFVRSSVRSLMILVGGSLTNMQKKENSFSIFSYHARPQVTCSNRVYVCHHHIVIQRKNSRLINGRKIWWRERNLCLSPPFTLSNSVVYWYQQVFSSLFHHKSRLDICSINKGRRKKERKRGTW